VLQTQDGRFGREEMAMQTAPNKLEVLFKATEGGYVFRAPNPWVVGQANHYFVTEAQKSQVLSAMYMPQWAIGVFWLVFFAVCFGGGTVLLYFLTGDPDPTTVDIAIMIALAVAGVLLPLPLIGYWQLYRLGPILRTLRPTEERISFREIAEATRKSTSAREYTRNCMLCGIAFGMMMLNAGLQLSMAINKESYLGLALWSIAAFLFGFAMVKNGLLAMRKANET
jgi:hypothetical protein